MDADMTNSINAIGQRGREYLLDREDIIMVPEYNIRKDYGDIEGEDLSSIKEGIRQPLIGFMKDGKFYGCDGFRRMAKYDHLGLTYKIPCKLDDRCQTQNGRILLALEMASAKSLTMLERANGYKLLLNDGMTIEEIAEKTFKTGTSIRDCLALLEAPELVKSAIVSNQISPTEALEVIRSEGENAEEVIEKAVEIAKEMGKSKATAKHVKLAKESDGCVDTDELVEFLQSTTDFSGVDWSKFSPSVLKKLIKQLTYQ